MTAKEREWALFASGVGISIFIALVSHHRWRRR